MGFNQVADALGDQARRHILVELLDHNPVKQSAIVAKNEPREDEKREVQLIHNHLPKLDDMDYIGWNRDHGTIVKGPRWDEIEPVVRLLSDNKERIPSDTF